MERLQGMARDTKQQTVITDFLGPGSGFLNFLCIYPDIRNLSLSETPGQSWGGFLKRDYTVFLFPMSSGLTFSFAIFCIYI